MSALRRLSTEELRSGGYLQEANRRFFHPLGLALAVQQVTEFPGGEPRWDVFVMDMRDEPGGVVFAPEVDLMANAVKVRDEEDRRTPKRLGELGFFVQPVGSGPP